jgi:hypothetical protein
MRVVATRRLGPRLALFAVGAIFVVLSLYVAWQTPPWAPNDEIDHVKNVETLAAGHLYRMQHNVDLFHPGEGDEAHEPPAYYAMLAGWQRLLQIKPFRLPPSPWELAALIGSRPAGSAPVLTAAERTDRSHLRALRVPGVVLGVLTLLLTALAARRLSRDPWTPVVAIASIALIPRYLYVVGSVNNDNLAFALAGAGTALAVWAVVRPRGAWRAQVRPAIAIGAVAGGLVLTKETALILVPGLLLAAYLSGATPRDGLRLAAVALGTTVLVGSPWLIHNTVSYGDPLALQATQQYLTKILPFAFHVDSPPKVLFVDMPKLLYRSLWYSPLPGQFFWPWWAYLALWLTTVAALAGPRRQRTAPSGRSELQVDRLNPGARRRAVWVLIALAALPLLFVWIYGLETSFVSSRYALVGLPAFGCLIALGTERLVWPTAARFALAGLCLAGTIVGIQRDVITLNTRINRVADHAAVTSTPHRGADAVPPRHRFRNYAAELRRNAQPVPRQRRPKVRS